MSHQAGMMSKGARALVSVGAGVAGTMLGHDLQHIGHGLAYVMGHVFTHFGAELTSHLSKDILGRAHKNPKLLNHDLQHLFSSAIQQAISNGIVASYEHEKGGEAILTKILKNKLQDLAQRFEHSFDISTNQPLSSTDLIGFLQSSPGNGYRELFSQRLGKHFSPEQFFDEHHFPSDFVRFFEKNLMPFVRILFIEGLKDKHHDKALVAYEQMMAEETYKSLQDIKTEITALKANGTLQQSKYAYIPEEEFSLSVSRITSAEQLRPVFAEGLKKYFDDFDRKLDDILELERDTNSKVTGIDIKTTRIEKGVKKGIALSYLLIAIAVGGSLTAYFLFRPKTFHATIELRDQANKALSQGLVAIEYGIKKEKASLNNDGMAMFTQIPSHFEQDSVEILLLDELEKNYTLDSSSAKILLKEDAIIHVRVTQKPPTPQPVVTPPKDSGKVVKDPSKPGTTPVTYRNNGDQQSNAGAKALSGARYKQVDAPDNISFTTAGSNKLEFHGTVGRESISGTMKLSGNVLQVIKGNVTGSLYLSNNNNALTGTLVITETKVSHDVDMKSL